MKITIEALVHADLDSVWQAWNTPADITQWNAASDDWHTPSASVDLREGGRLTARMEAKDGSAGFDFTGVFTRIEPKRLIEYRLDDGRSVSIEFHEVSDGVVVRETFEAEGTHPPEMQRAGWQAILDNFTRYVERKAGRA